MTARLMKSSAIADTFTVERTRKPARPAGPPKAPRPSLAPRSCSAAKREPAAKRTVSKPTATPVEIVARGRAGERHGGVRRHRLAFASVGLVVLVAASSRRASSFSVATIGLPRAWPERPPDLGGAAGVACELARRTRLLGRPHPRTQARAHDHERRNIRPVPAAERAVGDSARAITIATYPLRNAYATAVSRSKSAQMTSKREAAGGGLVVWSRTRPTSVYLAFPGVPQLVEVYAPDADAGPHAGALRAHPPRSLAGCTDSVNPCKGPPTLRLACFGVMPRKLLIGAFLALAFAAPAAAQTTLMPGVTYERGVQFTPHGPVAIHIVRGPRPTGLYALRPALSNETIQGLERVTVDAEAPLGGRDDGRRQRRLLRGLRPAQRRADARRGRREPAVRRPFEHRCHAGRRPRRPSGRVLRHLARARPAP